MRALFVLRKELREIVRDRRSLFSGLFYGVWGPMVMGIALLALARDRGDIGTMPLVVDTPARAPALIAFLESRDIAVSAAPGDLEAAVRNRRAPIALTIDDRYEPQLRQRERRPRSHCSTTPRGANRRAVRRGCERCWPTTPGASATRGWCCGASRLPRSPPSGWSSATSRPQPHERRACWRRCRSSSCWRRSSAARASRRTSPPASASAARSSRSCCIRWIGCRSSWENGWPSPRSRSSPLASR